MNDITAYHNSWLNNYREPFGAVPCNSKVNLKIDIQACGMPCQCSLRIWTQAQGEVLLPMEMVQGDDAAANASGIISAQITYDVPALPGLVWYYFVISCNGDVFFYGNNDGGFGGEGQLSRQAPASYQLTVHKPSPAPKWWKEGLAYQIYTDRFARGADWQDRAWKIKHDENRNGPTKLLQLDWRDKPFLYKDDNGRVERWPFFGGTLQGIREKLPYLHSLGVTIIYLNPIFEAASNHKYDTGDYMKIDEAYGDDLVFHDLIESAKSWGISIILDGVFSHVGADSKYFNKYGNYHNIGAFQSQDSEYSSWFKVNEDHSYECWWGVDDLPNVDEMNPSYQDYIWRNDDSVIRHWLRAGAKGWRLDVADELPDEFIKNLRTAIKETDPDALLLGEVWEDASNKQSYGKQREYFYGDELDATMNYPFRDFSIAFITGAIDATEVHRRVMQLYENYPKENFMAAMNLIGSHDRIRILTYLGEAPDETAQSEWGKQAFLLSHDQMNLAKSRLKLLSLWQMAFPGVPCIYYGDEAGVQGYTDPHNRGTYPWGREDQDLLAWYRLIGNMRMEYEVLRTGEFKSSNIGRFVYCFCRYNENERIVAIINPARYDSEDVVLDLLVGESVALELLSGAVLEPIFLEPDSEHGFTHVRSTIPNAAVLSGQALHVHIGPLEAKLVLLKKAEKKNRPMVDLPKSAGILCHVTSLPSAWGCGDIGSSAIQFCNFLQRAGQKIWQILPLNPPGLGNSPYSAFSVFAGNELLIDCEMLAQDGLISTSSCLPAKPALSNTHRSDFDVARENKFPVFKEAFSAFNKDDSDFIAFCEKNQEWLEDYCLYRALKDEFNHAPWQKWPKDIQQRTPEAIAKYTKKCADTIGLHKFLQYEFFKQWDVLHEYAKKRNISILGDIPFYVSADSSDTWAGRELFAIDSCGEILRKGGAPPDEFCVDGQNWETPIYEWEHHKKQTYTWWIKRFAHNLALFDYIRLDHFRGFDAFWQIPGEGTTAASGSWIKGPGKDFFEVVESVLGPLPLLAEDLGFRTASVDNLKHTFSYPGMKIYQFTGNEGISKENSDSASRNVYYTGTHDNDTLAGFISSVYGIHDPASLNQRCDEIIEALYSSEAPWVIVPLQDIWHMNSDMRMNIPGTPEGNWTWAAAESDFIEESARQLKLFAKAYGR